MQVLEFIREHEDWEELLAGEPYFVKTIWDGDYFLLRYNQLASDFTNQIVRECRGSIFYLHEDGVVEPVCVPFYKFGNYGESYVPLIDWASAVTMEKVDGSLMKVWWHNGEWHVSTNNTIDARNAKTKADGLTFYDIFMRALEKSGNPQDFFECLDRRLTYMFELVSPETRVTIAYDTTALYYLGARNILSLEEIPYTRLPIMDYDFVEKPKIYSLRSLEDCLQVAAKMGADEEGFVICDKNFNRVKIKSLEYLLASKVRNNNVITVKRIVEAMRAGVLDDFYAYADDYQPYIDQILGVYQQLARDLDKEWREMIKENAPVTSRKQLAEVIKGYSKIEQAYFFRAFERNGIYEAYGFLAHLPTSTLVDLIKDKLL